MAESPSKSAQTGAAPAPRSRRRLFLAGFAVALLGALGASGWVAWTQWLQPEPVGQDDKEPQAHEAEGIRPLPSVEARYLPVPEIVAVLADPPHVARVGLTLEALPGKEPLPTEADLQRLGEEVRRWLASQNMADLGSAASMWTMRARVLAIARDLFPAARIRDVLVSGFILQ
ncbi:flagellar basal body-associated FliL family protein [Benzoatithermus flavus]|uniref:Flagellar protein FliL n=1 Tax=Benzoatithermus flavus TaxID=3108223 RepID=A0ABU8XVM9_9PROT